MRTGRKRKWHSLIVLNLIILVIILSGTKDKDIREPDLKIKKGTAIVITGAAARISQEVALLEHLYNRGMLNDVVFISGASSGALNAAVLNAILSGKYSWDEYIAFLGNLKNGDVFIRNGRKLPADTNPLRNLITRVIIDSIGYRNLCDLPIPTSISVVDLKVLPLKERTFRFCNRKINPESDSSLNIVDVLMASTAIPIAFPPARISNIKTIRDVPYHDGGVASDHVPFQALIEFEKYMGIEVEKMIIVSRKRDSMINLAGELEQFGIDRINFFNKYNVFPDALTNRGFINRLKDIQKESPSLAQRTFVYAPEFDEDFLLLDFSTLKKQYEVTAEWAKTHDPVPLNEYLQRW